MIVVTRFITADNTDLLNGTDLQSIPADGQIDFYFASTQADTEVSLTGPGNEPIMQDRPALLRANGVPSLVDDIPVSVPVTQGGLYRVNVNVVTAATFGMIAVFRSDSELR